MFKACIFLHHIGVEIMGKEYEPQGTFQHICVIAVSAAFLFFAVYGFISFFKKLLKKSELSETKIERIG